MSFNWVIVATFAVGFLAILGAEIKGIVANGEHRVDTITELWYLLRARVGPFRAVLSAGLAAVLLWTWAHLSLEGRRR